jgi:hypothetical protein
MLDEMVGLPHSARMRSDHLSNITARLPNHAKHRHDMQLRCQKSAPGLECGEFKPSEHSEAIKRHRRTYTQKEDIRSKR